jgi:hypothetical protein
MKHKNKSMGPAPITSRIKKTTKGGMTTQPLLNMGAPVKMKSKPPKAASPHKDGDTADGGNSVYMGGAFRTPESARRRRVVNEFLHKGFLSERTKHPQEAIGNSLTPYTVKDGKGTIHGPKVSYNTAYEKRGKAYKDMSLSEYSTESKRQTKVFKETGKWDAPKPRKKKLVVSVKVKPVITLQTKKPVAEVKIKAATVAPEAKSGADIRKQSKINKKLSQAAEARSNGNEKKALRKEKAAERKAARLAKKKK